MGEDKKSPEAMQDNSAVSDSELVGTNVDASEDSEDAHFNTILQMFKKQCSPNF